MLRFVNAKINIGLQIVRRREDGYHDLQTLFYPIGLHAGTPVNPQPFCDILEVTLCPESTRTLIENPTTRISLHSDCAYAPETNLVYRAAALYCGRFSLPFALDIRLDKHIPDGAGIGGGSADAAFTLMMLDELAGGAAGDDDMAQMALNLGADCPFFLINRPAYAEGVGERLQEVPLDLGGKWLLLVRPRVRVSTREAFAGVVPAPARFDLRKIPEIPVNEWKNYVHNDFEDSIFPRFPELAGIKKALYDTGAAYASLTGSGSCLYGIYAHRETAAGAASLISRMAPVESTYELLL